MPLGHGDNAQFVSVAHQDRISVPRQSGYRDPAHDGCCGGLWLVGGWCGDGDESGVAADAVTAGEVGFLLRDVVVFGGLGDDAVGLVGWDLMDRAAPRG